jgi:hypothetical protein
LRQFPRWALLVSGRSVRGNRLGSREARALKKTLFKIYKRGRMSVMSCSRPLPLAAERFSSSFSGKRRSHRALGQAHVRFDGVIVIVHTIRRFRGRGPREKARGRPAGGFIPAPALGLLHRQAEGIRKSSRSVYSGARSGRKGISLCPLLRVRREKAALSSGCKAHPANAPAGSNRSSHGGDKMAEACGVAGHI